MSPKYLKRSTVVDLLQSKFSELKDLHKERITNVPFYGMFYQLTYNHSEIDVSWYADIFKQLQLPKKAKILETFCGAGTDSQLLRKKFKTYQFDGADYDISYVPSDTIGTSLMVYKEDVTKPYTRSEKYDLVYSSYNNRSLCDLHSFESVVKHAEYLKGAVKENGHAIISYYDCEGLQDDIDFSTYAFEYGCSEKYKGFFGRWSSVLITGNSSTQHQGHLHHDILEIFKQDPAKDFDIHPIHVWYATYRSRAYSTNSIMYAMESNGFVLEKVLEQNSYLLFKKCRS